MTVAEPSEVAAAAAALAPRAPVPPRVDAGERMVAVPIGDGVADAAAALRLLDAAGVRIDDFVVRSPSLDDVFLALTGTAGGEGP